MSRIAVVGSRGYPYDSLVAIAVNRLPDGTTVVSGGALGVDSKAANTAMRRGMKCDIIKADWNRHGRHAGILRNTSIVLGSDGVIAFWDGKSRGTVDTIVKARDAGIPVWVFGPTGDML